MIAHIPDTTVKNDKILKRNKYLQIVLHFKTATIKLHNVIYQVKISSLLRLSHK